MAKREKPSQAAHLRAVEQPINKVAARWGRDLIAAGWTPIPTIFLERQRRLGLDPVDLNIILLIARHWWEKDRLPFPSKRSIAAAVHRAPRTVQRRIQKLIKAGLLETKERWTRDGRQLSNIYDFHGLIAKATPLARELVKAREAARRERATQRRPGWRPRVVKNAEDEGA